MKVLLHACCAPCGAVVIQALKKDGHEVAVYFYNSNIFPLDEYELRSNEVKRFCEQCRVEFIAGEYNHQKWLIAVAGLEKEPEGGKRCEQCFIFRLSETAQKAHELGYDAFATTLTISPHKPAELINRIGDEVGQIYGLKFIDNIWRKGDGYKRACELSRKEHFHRQKYCGCEYSNNRS